MSSLNNYFVIDSDDSYQDFNQRRLTRNFEELITERGNLEIDEVQSKCRFENIFNNIKDKIFASSEGDDLDITESERKSIEEKYNLNQSKQTIKELKEKISELYIKKIEHSVMIEERRRLFKTFSKNIKASIESIEQMEPHDEDPELNRLLEKRINMYYHELGIEKMVECEYKLNSEFQVLRKTLIELSHVSLTQCMICLDRTVSWFIDPCGHTLCNECKEKTQEYKTCHYCRVKRTKFNKLYL